MARQTELVQAVEKLGYRVTVGDVAAEAGISLVEAQQGVVALAADVQAHLQVSESGEIAYVFSRGLKAQLLSKYWRLRLAATWNRIWKVLFYLIRISFGILLLLSLLIIAIAIGVLIFAASASQRQDNDDRRGGYGGGMIFIPRYWISPNLFYLFDFDYGRRARRRQRSSEPMNFFEAVFSFLFGDGDPNVDLEERRWQEIAAVIRNHQGAITAEQAAPYLDDLGQGWVRENEDYMLPVLTRYNGIPQVSDEGGIIYHFPELQVMAEQRRQATVRSFLQEFPRRFSQASSTQVLMAIGLGGINLVGALALLSWFKNPELLQQLAQNLAIRGVDQNTIVLLTSFISFVQSISWLLLGYGGAFLAIPLVRYFWVQWQNSRITARNQKREQRSLALTNPDPMVQHKLAYAQQFAARTIVGSDDLAYTTERDLTDQEFENRDKLDEEWRRRLEGYEPL